MSEDKHTSGPWNVVEYGDGDSLVIHYGDEHRICFMATPGDSPRAMARIEANAALIASAPDLLASLREFMEDERFQVGVGGNPIAVDAMLSRARAAISKATGGEKR